MMSSGATAAAAAARGRFPFTPTQWQELEHQALVYKYMISGMPIPPDLLFTIKRSLDSSVSSSNLLLHQSPHSIGPWNCFQMGFGRKIDPEPGRCRRTDGKKWRCSKEAYPDSKYCERHMHRGRNRSRKPVEVNLSTPQPPTSATSSTPQTQTHTNNHTPTAIPISSMIKFPNYPSSTHSSITSDSLHPNHAHMSYNSNSMNNSLLYSHSPSSRPLGFANSSAQDPFLLDSGTYSHSDKDYRNSYGQGMKDEVDEHPFFSETSGSTRSGSDTWQLEPLTMGSSKQRTFSDIQNGYSYSQLQGLSNSPRQKQNQDHTYYDLPLKLEKEDKPQKVMHHFFDEWPKNKDSTTQLSISMPNPSHDFFMTHNDK